ncbi:YceI family protein [uncultured Cocleimonas sp.]|uniref:YceI family protein n=1 Tax=uncultured Cocleimonas sp. TaxID=1051587 RepID=UPI0026118E80|nr:YceI family protein [uncultured Cocleimonas sp.]
MKLKTIATSFLALGLLAGTVSAQAADYAFDKKGAHQFVQFRVQHLGYSWLYGRFNDFDGNFSYDAEQPEKAKVSVKIDTSSVDTNHAERDKHIRSDDFLNVDKFPEATFTSTSFDGKTLKGDLTLHGVTKPVDIAIEKIGEGEDPWGGYRAGFEGRTTFKMADFGIKKDLGPKSADVEMILSVEGVRTKGEVKK